MLNTFIKEKAAGLTEKARNLDMPEIKLPDLDVDEKLAEIKASLGASIGAGGTALANALNTGRDLETYALLEIVLNDEAKTQKKSWCGPFESVETAQVSVKMIQEQYQQSQLGEIETVKYITGTEVGTDNADNADEE